MGQEPMLGGKHLYGGKSLTSFEPELGGSLAERPALLDQLLFPSDAQGQTQAAARVKEQGRQDQYLVPLMDVLASNSSRLLPNESGEMVDTPYADENRIAAVRALTYLGQRSEELDGLLIRLLSHPDMSVRKVVCWALGEMRVHTARLPLERTLLETWPLDKNTWQVKEEKPAGLGAKLFGGLPGTPWKRTQLRQEAIRALARLGDARSVPVLNRMLNDKQARNDNVNDIVDALSVIGTPAAEAVLIERMNQSPVARFGGPNWVVMNALASIRRESAVNAVLDYMSKINSFSFNTVSLEILTNTMLDIGPPSYEHLTELVTSQVADFRMLALMLLEHVDAPELVVMRLLDPNVLIQMRAFQIVLRRGIRVDMELLAELAEPRPRQPEASRPPSGNSPFASRFQPGGTPNNEIVGRWARWTMRRMALLEASEQVI